MTLRTILILVAFCALLGFDAKPARSKATRDQLTADEAMSLVRRINTAEATVLSNKDGSHQYASIFKLLQSATGQKYLNMPVNQTDETSGTLKGYAVSLLVSPDGHRYSLELIPASPKECGAAFFSTEAAVIYIGKALGCSS
jgi:hypothetical protein